jgi:hypothetical protein
MESGQGWREEEDIYLSYIKIVILDRNPRFKITLRGALNENF